MNINLKHYMEENDHWSIQEVAYASGFAVDTVRDWYNGRRVPFVRNLIRIMNVFDYDVAIRDNERNNYFRLTENNLSSFVYRFIKNTRGYTYKQAAELGKIDRHTIAAWAYDENEPTLGKFEKLMKGMNCDIVILHNQNRRSTRFPMPISEYDETSLF